MFLHIFQLVVSDIVDRSKANGSSFHPDKTKDLAPIQMPDKSISILQRSRSHHAPESEVPSAAISYLAEPARSGCGGAVPALPLIIRPDGAI